MNNFKRFLMMSSYGENPIPKSNQIFYTTVSGETITIGTTVAGKTVLSHTYTDKGIITVDGDITALAAHEFDGQTTLTSISLPNCCTDAGNWGLQSCTSLVYFVANGLTYAGYYTFAGCTSLNMTQLPKKLKSSHREAFGKCTSLALTSLPDGFYYIYADCFVNCTNNRLQKLPDAVEAIIDGAFSYNTNSFTNLVIPAKVKTMSASFYGCPKNTITVDSSNTVFHDDGNCIIRTANNSVVEGCNNSIIPSNVTSIEQKAFYECSELQLSSLPETITSIGNLAFKNCSQISISALPSGLTNLGDNSFQNCTNITITSLPQTLTKIGGGVFNGCTNMSGIAEIPDNCTIGNDVFVQTNITDVIVHETTTISAASFRYISKLQTFTIYITTPPTLQWYAWQGTPVSTATLYVPADSLEAYQNSDWKSFGSIVAIS